MHSFILSLSLSLSLALSLSLSLSLSVSLYLSPSLSFSQALSLSLSPSLFPYLSPPISLSPISPTPIPIYIDPRLYIPLAISLSLLFCYFSILLTIHLIVSHLVTRTHMCKDSHNDTLFFSIECQFVPIPREENGTELGRQETRRSVEAIRLCFWSDQQCKQEKHTLVSHLS